MSKNWTPKPPATNDEIKKLKRAIPIVLPEDYLDILRHYNGGEGELGLPPMWLQLWSVDEVIEGYYLEFYQFEYPGYFFFATNGLFHLILGVGDRSGTASLTLPLSQRERELIHTTAKNKGNEALMGDWKA